MRWNLAAMAWIVAVVAGCDDSAFNREGPGRAPATRVAGQLAPVDEEGRPLGQEAATTPPEQQPEQPVEQPVEQPAAAGPETVREEVAPGVSGRGDYGPGLITTSLSAYFRVQERLVFEAQIQPAMNMYRAEHGYFPKSHEEFMEKIIEANSIILPELRGPNERYVYDPEKAATQTQYDAQDPPLFVERTQ